MHRNDADGARCDRGLHRRRIDGEGYPIRVGKYHVGPGMRDHGRGGNPGIRRGDHLVTGAVSDPAPLAVSELISRYRATLGRPPGIVPMPKGGSNCFSERPARARSGKESAARSSQAKKAARARLEPVLNHLTSCTCIEQVGISHLLGMARIAEAGVSNLECLVDRNARAFEQRRRCPRLSSVSSFGAA
jgi:hypothetical protein